MADLFEQLEAASEAGSSDLPGFRLHRLEILNWGTFDGVVHTMELNGQTTLLVGQNGTGKSTLVDALLTLLVRPGRTRNYNLAAGGNKTERTEKSYILGAFDRRSQEDDNRGEVRFLRKDKTTCAVLLACFRNSWSGRAFTLAQLLYLSDGGVEQIYCFAPDQRSISQHCSGLKGVDKLPQELRKRGFKSTTKYVEYFEWFRKATGVREQSMDMFNQTVAVKDIQRLTDFIRKHMLEAKPWGEKVDEVFRHFKDLSEAHQELERVRNQRDLLEPIEKQGAAFRRQAEDLKVVERRLAAADSYFPQKVIELVTPAIAKWQNDMDEVRNEQQRLLVEIDKAQSECYRIQRDIDKAGGERVKQIPYQIEAHQKDAAAKRLAAGRYLAAIRETGVSQPKLDASSFASVLERLVPLRDQLQAEVTLNEQQQRTTIESIVEPRKLLNEADAELQMLMKRQGNLPTEYVEIRQGLCDELRLTERDLPFAAELIAVRINEKLWEPSIEMVLRSFALSLLVPKQYYHQVSKYVDQTKLRDSRGHGQKLVYLLVAERRSPVSGPIAESNSLFRKLEFREGWSPLIPWVKAEVEESHNFRCCETVEEFQRHSRRAITRERHVKFNEVRHEKNDRDRASDPRFFVLGWDNKEKKQHLAAAIQSWQDKISALNEKVNSLLQVSNELRQRLSAIEAVQRFTQFTEIDYLSHEVAVTDLQLELQTLVEGNDTIRQLKQSLVVHQQQAKSMQATRDQLVRKEQRLDSDIGQANRLLSNNLKTIAKNIAAGDFEKHVEVFSELEAMFSHEPLSLENHTEKENECLRTFRSERDRLSDQLQPLMQTVVNAMNRFLNAHPHEGLDLDSSIGLLPDFLKLLERIREDDLPRFEDRFKERLNEKVGHEIGVLRGNLNTDRTLIEDRINLLNTSLKNVQYGDGTHMRLDARPVRDPEIKSFRQELDACVSGQFEGTLAADEARYKKIASLIAKLRDEQRWRMRVTDVRNWFDFAAVEIDDITGAERSYHDDSAGQSGGEKAKLAFTILIAAIAFQYDLDPHRHSSDRFHFVVVDEMFSRVDDGNSAYALELFRKFGLQLLIVAPLDAKARVTEPYVGCYLHVSKDDKTNRSQVLGMTAREFHDQAGDTQMNTAISHPNKPR